MNKILIRNDQKKLPFGAAGRKMIRDAVNASIREMGGGCFEVSVLITDNEKIHQINKEFRGVDKPTDVLSFPMDSEGEAAMLGDIVISLETALVQAEEYGHSLEREISFLTVHSMMHLFGYDHENEADRARMREMEEKVLGVLNLAR